MWRSGRSTNRRSRKHTHTHATQDINFGISIKRHRQMTSVFIRMCILFVAANRFISYISVTLLLVLPMCAMSISRGAFRYCLAAMASSASQFQFKIKLIQFYGDFVVQITLSRPTACDNGIIRCHKPALARTHRDAEKLIPILFAWLVLRRRPNVLPNLCEYYTLSL